MKEKWKNLLLAIVTSVILTALIWVIVFLPVLNNLSAEDEGSSLAEVVGGKPYTNPVVLMTLFYSIAFSASIFLVGTIALYFVIAYLKKIKI